MILMVLVGAAMWVTLALAVAFGWNKVFGQTKKAFTAPVRLYVDPQFVAQEIALWEQELRVGDQS